MKRLPNLLPVLHFLGTTFIFVMLWWYARDQTYISEHEQGPKPWWVGLSSALLMGGFPFAIAALVNFRQHRSTAAIFIFGFLFQFLGPVAALAFAPPQLVAPFLLLILLASCWLLTRKSVSAPERAFTGWKLALINFACGVWLLAWAGGVALVWLLLLS